MNDVKNDLETFESFVKQYPKYLELAQRFKKSPGDILNLLYQTGEIILSRSSDEMLKTISDNLKTFVSTRNFKLSDDAINSLDSLMNFLKENNHKKRG
jgi:hypothetical protein